KFLPGPAVARRKLRYHPRSAIVETYLEGLYPVGAPRPSNDLHYLTDSKARSCRWMRQDGFRRDVPHGTYGASFMIVVERRDERTVGAMIRQSHPVEPLHGISGIEARRDQANGEAVFDRKWLAVHLIRD